MTITLQVGKRYVQRNGEVSPRVEANHWDAYPFRSECASYRPDGRVFLSHYSALDLISEYHESPAVDPLTGMPAVYDVPMIETGPRFKIGDRFVTSFCARPEYIGRVLTVQSIGDISKDLYYSDDKYHLSFKRSTCRPATPKEIAAADRPVLDWSKPLQTKLGKPARIICRDRKGGRCHMVVLVQEPMGDEIPKLYGEDGTINKDDPVSADGWTLVNVGQEFVVRVQK